MVKKKIFDCMMFHKELDLLKLRVETLKDHVDMFVVSCGDRVHLTGEKIEPFVETDEFRKFAANSGVDIRPFVVELSDDKSNNGNWIREKGARVAILDHLKEINKEYPIDPEALILISDTDEIPNPNALEEVKQYQFCSLEQMYFIHFADLFSTKCVTGTTSCKWAKLLGMENDLGEICQWLRDHKDVFTIVENGGWHLSYVGGRDHILDKCRSIAEGNKDYTLDFIDEKIKNAVKNLSSPYSHDGIKERELMFVDNSREEMQKFLVAQRRFTGTVEKEIELDIMPKPVFEGRFNNLCYYNQAPF